MGAPELMSHEPAPIVGEVLTVDLREPVNDSANDTLDRHSGVDAEIDLGKELGKVDVNRVRFGMSDKLAHLKAFIHDIDEAHPHASKVIVGTVSVGLVLTAVAGIRYKNKR